LFKPLLGFGLRAHIGTLWATANARADQAVIALTLTSVDLGLYAVAVTLTAGTALVGTSLAIITLPAVAGAPSRSEALAMFARCIRTCLAISIVVALLVFVSAPLIIQIFFGPAFADAVPIARILLVASVGLSMNPVLGSGLRGLNRPISASIGDGLAAVVAISSLIILVPRLGTIGAAIAVGLAYGTSCAWMTVYARRMGVPLIDMFAIQRDDLVWLRNRFRAMLVRAT
jgi:O-antigen/teichoic acid export membrane protein